MVSPPAVSLRGCCGSRSPPRCSPARREAAQDPFTGVEQDRFAAGDSPADRIAGPWSG